MAQLWKDLQYFNPSVRALKNKKDCPNGVQVTDQYHLTSLVLHITMTGWKKSQEIRNPELGKAELSTFSGSWEEISILQVVTASVVPVFDITGIKCPTTLCHLSSCFFFYGSIMYLEYSQQGVYFVSLVIMPCNITIS